MARAQTLLLIGCLLQGVLCQDWKATMPQSIEALSGSCVTIPCSFTIDEKYRQNLNTGCIGKWKKDYYNDSGIIVFDSSQANSKGIMTGNLTQNNCTTVLNDIPANGSGNYYFRIQCNTSLKWNYQYLPVQITVKASPPQPSLTPYSVNVTEGTSVSLNCSSAVFCPSLPPSLTWAPSLGDRQKNTVQTNFMISVLTFTATPLHNGLNISCTACYQQQAGTNISTKTSLIITVLYAPKNTSISISPPGPVLEGSSVTLTCNSDANPAVDNYTWYRVNGTLNCTVRSGRNLSFNEITSSNSGEYFCVAQNKHGQENSVTANILVQSKLSLSMLVPAVALPSIGLILCVLLCIIREHTSNRSKSKTKNSDKVVNQALASGVSAEKAPEETIYVNSMALKEGPQENQGLASGGDSVSLSKSSINKTMAAKDTEKEDGNCDVLYSSVIWKKKSEVTNRDDSVDVAPSTGSCQEEEKCELGNVGGTHLRKSYEVGILYDKFGPKKDEENSVNCEYAQVNFKKKDEK